MQETDFAISSSGVIVWKRPQVHPLLRRTDTNHPDFRRKVADVFPSGREQGLPKTCSEHSEDACTWYYFSPLIDDSERRTWVLTRLLREAFGREIPPDLFEALPVAQLRFWHGRKTPALQLPPPPSRVAPEGLTEVDLIVSVGDLAVVFIEAKYLSGVAESVKHDPARDQVIRNLDVGSWFARQRFGRFYFLLLQYGDHQNNAEEAVGRYARKPQNIREKLSYREDLTRKDIDLLSRSVGFVRWPDPLTWRNVLSLPRTMNE